MSEPIQAKVFQRKNTVAIARGLIGQVLVRRHADGRETRHVITETEAYCGETDLASHARAGRTARTDVMYRAGGIWYVYLCYGIHEMLNLVTGPEDFPAAILIRGVADASGPGRLTKALEIGRALNGLSATSTESGLWIEAGGARAACAGESNTCDATRGRSFRRTGVGGDALAVCDDDREGRCLAKDVKGAKDGLGGIGGSL